MKEHAPNDILVVEDEQDMREYLRDVLSENGFRVTTTANGNEALSRLRERTFKIVISDIKMPKMDGLTLLDEIRGGEGLPPFVILITAFGDVDDAVKLIDRGAYDYLIKPFKTDQLLIAVSKALRELSMRRKIKELEDLTQTRYSLHSIVGKSPAMQKMFKFIEKIAESNGKVLVEGETGSGKELISKAIHLSSGRKEGPFIPVNCAAIPEGLLESELFGHVKGAFTDAKFDKKGLLAEARGGTILLDEIGEMPPLIQGKLLRTLQDGMIKPLGSNEHLPLDARIISATNKDLKEEVSAGRFREDLFYRLNTFRIEVPPLRERREDIPLLVEEFLELHQKDRGRIGLSPEVMRLFLDYHWPGNIRELENVIERCVYLAEDGVIRLNDLPGEMHVPDISKDGFYFYQIGSLENMEKQYIAYVLEKCGGNKKKAAEALGINRKTIHRKLEET